MHSRIVWEKYEVDLNAEDAGRNTIAHTAVLNNDVALFDFLLSLKSSDNAYLIDFEKENQDRNSPLDIALIKTPQNQYFIQKLRELTNTPIYGIESGIKIR